MVDLLELDNPVAQLGQGDIFGEMTCMSLYPRSATVRAKTDCVMLEMLRNVLDVIQRNKTLRADLKSNYRKRALEDHPCVRSPSVCISTLSSDFIETLAQKVELIRLTPKGEVLCRGRAMRRQKPVLMVRIGFVKMVEEHPAAAIVWCLPTS